MQRQNWASGARVLPLALILAACSTTSDATGQGADDVVNSDSAAGDVAGATDDTSSNADSSAADDAASLDDTESLDGTTAPLPDVPNVLPDSAGQPDTATVPDTSGPDVCTPACVGKFCGPDGCGGSCGGCLPEYACSAAGQCEPLPVSDACVAEADAAILCTLNVTEATADCVLGCALSPAGCQACVAAATGLSVDCASCYGAVLQCAVSACALQCFDATSPTCAACLATSCNPALEACAGKTTCPCVPTCDASTCGLDDGCGGSCPACPCEPVCGESAVCGDDDSCGGICTACPQGQVCDATDGCVEPPAIAGDTCDMPIVIATLPFTTTGNTQGFVDNYSVAESQPACGFSEPKGQGTPDTVLAFTPEVTGDYTVSNSGGGVVLYVVTDCASVGSACVAGGEGNTGPISLSLEASVTYYIIVDAPATESFDVQLEASCQVNGTCCTGSCGSTSTVCGCDPTCVTAGTCCDDFCAACSLDFPDACPAL